MFPSHCRKPLRASFIYFIVIFAVFSYSTVVASVLDKDHSKLGASVSLVACSPLEELDESNDPEASAHEPSPVEEIKKKPVTLPIDRLTAKFLLQKPDFLDALSKEILMTIAVDSDRGIVELHPNESSPDDYSGSEEQFKHLLSDKFCKVDIEVPPEAAGSIYPMVMQQCSSAQNMICDDFSDNHVSVAGVSSFVLDLQKTVQDFCRRILQTSYRCTLTDEEFRFFTGCRAQEVKDRHLGVKVVPNEKDRSLSFSGSIHNVDQLKRSMPTILAHLKIPVNLPNLVVLFLKKGKSFSIMETQIGRANVVPYFSPDRDQLSLSLLCCQDDVQYAETAAMKIAAEVSERELEFPQFSDVSDSQRFSDFQQQMSKTYTYLSKVERGKFKLVCRNEIFPKLAQRFEKFVAEECSIKEKIFLKRGVWRLFNSVMEKKWGSVKEEMRNNEVDILSSSKPSAQKPFISIKGERKKVAKMKAKILELQASVKEHEMNLSCPGLVRYLFKDPHGQVGLNGLESEAKVCIELEVKKDEIEVTDVSHPSSGAGYKRICSATIKGRPVSVNVFVGDITTFTRAEVIVNTANEDLLHGGGVAGAVLDRGGSVITKDSNDYIRKYGRVAVGSAVLFPRVGNLPPPYKAIVHAVGPRWNSFGSNDREIAQLKKAVKTSLKVSRGYISIAIPAISGGMFGFPPDLAASTLVRGVVEFFEGDLNFNLNDVNFVISQDNVSVFMKAIKDHFESIHTFYDAPTPVRPLSSSPEENPHGHDYDKDYYDHCVEAVIDLPLADIPLDAEVTLCIYGESDSAVQRAEKRLNALIDTVLIYEDVVDESIVELPDSAKDTLKSFAKKHSVDIDIETDPDIHTIKIHGCQSDVLKLKDKVRDVLMEIRVYKANEGAAATVQKHVKWVRQYSDDQQEDCDPLVSYKIEQAFQQKERTFRYTDGSDRLKIDFSTMKEIDLESGDAVKMQRVDFSEGIACCM